MIISNLVPRSNRTHSIVGVAYLVALLAFIILLFGQKAQAAACTVPTTNYGTVDNITVTIPTTATYRVWSRMMVPDSTNDTYLLEIDGNKCYTVGGGSIPANTWTWVAYQNGNTTSYIDVVLTAGNHTFKAIGSAPNVSLDRFVLSSDLACTPSGLTGDCNSAWVPPHDNKILIENDGTNYYVENGLSHYIDKTTIRDCIAARRGTGPWLNVGDTIVPQYTSSAAAYCNYEQEPGLNFIRENNDPTVWLVRSGGTKQHVGVLCVVDAYTTVLKKFRVHVVPSGETAGHTVGSDFFGSPSICGALPG